MPLRGLNLIVPQHWMWFVGFFELLDLKLSDDEIKQLEEAYKPHPVLGHS